MVTEVKESLIIEGYDKFRDETGKKYAQYEELYRPNSLANEVCFSCKKCFGDCSWAESFKPISGWVAEKTTDANRIGSYKIYYCPEFVEGDASEGVEYDYDGCYALMEKLVASSAEVYKEAARIAKEEKYRFIHRTFSMHFDPEKWKKALNQMQYEAVLLEKYTDYLDRIVGFEFDEYDRNCLKGMYG